MAALPRGARRRSTSQATSGITVHGLGQATSDQNASNGLMRNHRAVGSSVMLAGGAGNWCLHRRRPPTGSSGAGPNRDGHSAETGLLQEWPANGPPQAVAGHRRRHRLLVVLGVQRPALHAGRARRRRIRDRVRCRHREEAVGSAQRPALPQRAWATGRAARRRWKAIASTRSAAAASWSRSTPPPARRSGR